MLRREFLLTAAASACQPLVSRSLFAAPRCVEGTDIHATRTARYHTRTISATACGCGATIPARWDTTSRRRKKAARSIPLRRSSTMGIPNVCMVPFTGTPRPQEYDEYAKQFDDPAIKRFTWSFIHGSARNSQEIKAAALRQAAKYKNFVGLDMDDFFQGHADPSPNGTNFDVWLAGNLTDVPEEQRWPVTLTVEFAEPLELDQVQLIQVDWKDGNFRTKDVMIELKSEDADWKEAGKAVMTNEPKAATAVRVPRQTVVGVRLKIVSTYDTGKTRALGRAKAIAGIERRKRAEPRPCDSYAEFTMGPRRIPRRSGCAPMGRSGEIGRHRSRRTVAPANH